ncbi:MAG: DevR family CRISPR-associated autoregulator [Candidatus Kapaibacteriota bacterium]|jgi:CRISPR-associated protein Cst2
MIKFLTFAVKTQINVHDLNNETGAGNVTDIRIMEFLDEAGNRIEAPAVSGRMLKHWHQEGIRQLILKNTSTSLRLCDGCKAGEPIRPGEFKNDKLVQVGKPEDKAIQECVICDIHGYLIAQEAKSETSEAQPESKEGTKTKKKGISQRRNSRAMFSWLMPVLGYPTAQRQVIHTRVSQQGAMAEGEVSAQMIFNKSYASGIYAFVSAIDVERIGLVESNLGLVDPYAVDDHNERKERIKIAIESYRLLLSGQMGASLSHSIPHQNPIEILVAYSDKGPLPFPVSPMYSDWLKKTIGLMPEGTHFVYFGPEAPDIALKKYTIEELFQEIISKV